MGSEWSRRAARRAVVPIAGVLVVLLATAVGAVMSRTGDAPAAGISVGTPDPPPPVAPTPGQSVDHMGLRTALAMAGIEVSPGTSIYAAQVVHDGAEPRYRAFDAGDGALHTDFWPASSIKVLAAVGALEFLAGMGFTGAAQVTVDDQSVTVADLYAEAIRDSSNEAYDQLVQLAGVDWLNRQFLTPGNGFRSTVIQRSYAGWDVRSSPAMTISEGARQVELPARESDGDYGCPEEGNCSNLLELSDSVRRIMLDDELPDAERFNVGRADIALLQEALLMADGFIETGAYAALGQEALVYNKPGEVPEDDCVDVAYVTDPPDDEYMVAIATPTDGRECATVSELAEVTLAFLARQQP